MKTLISPENNFALIAITCGWVAFSIYAEQRWSQASKLSLAYNVPGNTISAATVADNLMTALYFLMLVAIPSIPFFRKFYKHPHMDQVDKQGKSVAKTQAAAYWEPKEISLKDIAFCFAISAVIVWASSVVSGFLESVIPVSNPFFKMLNGFLGNMYLIMTTISMIVATVFSKKIEHLSGTQEIGTFLIYLFFFVIGVPASIMEIIKNVPLLFVFCAILVVINMAFCFVFGKLLHYNLEEIILASNANVGGPTTAVAMAVSKGQTELVGPILLVGTLGYVIGTYFGTFVGQILIG